MSQSSNAPGWHVVKLDDDAYSIVRSERDRLKKRHHASFSDAIREMKRKDKKQSQEWTE